ncbi:thermonuclease family protein [Sphingomonas mesophila]|uniref:thermonuclease family protein n=1 Tax=Sphingomonas mesophila TaxID=2303576 RepID=UPI000E5980CE|nr:thermonuclease family protein [Sphingomonas mesophila]
MLTFLLAAAFYAAPEPIYGIAVAGDGDSLTVAGQRVRLFGIDAPEFDQACTRAGKNWSCGREAADQLSKLVTGRQVRCAPTGVDDFGRTLARCSTAGIDVNTTMVALGYAVAFRRYSTDYVSAEEAARNNRRGMWAGTFEMPSQVRSAAREADRRPPSSRVLKQRPAAAPRVVASGACNIKGNRSRRGEWIYHVPGMPYYAQTRAEELFCSEADARAAGYRRALVR